MLGLFDSGLGGLTVLRRVRELLPQHDLLFFADQAHVPYGDRTPEDLLHLLQQNVSWLDARGVEAIVMACNTSCAMGERFGWPETRAQVLDLIESAAVAVQRASLSSIGVIATMATARSGAYARKIQARSPGARVVEVGAPELVPLVEAGKLHGDEPRSAVQRVCAQLPRDLDAVILACTHYPMLDEHFAAVLGDDVLRIDPALVQAERTFELATRLGVPHGSGALACFTNGDLDRFRSSLAMLIGDLAPAVHHLEAVEG
jgi:glutamate racemase